MRTHERRQEARCPVPGIWQDGCLRLRTGPALRLLDGSSWGVLVEGHSRLEPGRQLEVRVVTRDGSQLVRSRVVWARVSRLGADRLEYLAGLAFERSVDGVWREYRLPLPWPGQG